MRWRDFSRGRLPEDRIGEEAFQALGIFILDHRATNRHHERDRRVDLLIRSALGRVKTPAPVGFADHIAEAPLEDRIAVMAQVAGPHRCIELDNRGAEALGREFL
jgi:hypothetical protein